MLNIITITDIILSQELHVVNRNIKSAVYCQLQDIWAFQTR